MDSEIVHIENFRKIKNLKEELIDILSFLNDFIVKNTEPKKAAYYESVIRYKVDRVCYDLPNIPLSPEVFKLVEEIFTKLVEIKEKKNPMYGDLKRINEMYGRFKYLIEWCLLYYEETYILY